MNFLRKADPHDELYRDVLCFIGRFSHGSFGLREGCVEAFLCGCCYWFAYILAVRFSEYDPEIVVDLVANHFACRIDGEVYDIRGVITGEDYDWTVWEEYDD